MTAAETSDHVASDHVASDHVASDHVASDHVSIVELADVCARMRALSLDLFAELGSWVTATDPGRLQRWYASACHRHAWHADLWALRSPSIPSVNLESAVDAHRATRLPATPDEAAYRRILVELMVDVGSVRDRVDGDLDPATRHVLRIIGDDIADLSGI